MKKTLLITLLSTPVLAEMESSQVFFGVKGGYQLAIDYTYDYSNPKGAILGIYSGLQFTPSWRWDVGYQYHDELKADVTSFNVKTWLIESALRYDWYLQDNLSLYGRLGAAYWDMEKTQNSLTYSDATGFSPLGEVGVNYKFNPNVRLSTGYQYIHRMGKSNTGQYDSSGLLVSLAYSFGSARQTTFIDTAPTSIDDTPVQESVTATTPPQTELFSPKTIDGAFGFDSIELSQALIDQLTEVASVLNGYPQARATVVGYSDSTGPALYNQNLSERRAQAVVDKLIEMDVTPTQLEWRGEGVSFPVANNQTAEGRARNRRVEISIPSFKY